MDEPQVDARSRRVDPALIPETLGKEDLEGQREGGDPEPGHDEEEGGDEVLHHEGLVVDRLAEVSEVVQREAHPLEVLEDPRTAQPGYSGRKKLPFMTARVFISFRSQNPKVSLK